MKWFVRRLVLNIALAIWPTRTLIRRQTAYDKMEYEEWLSMSMS